MPADRADGSLEGEMPLREQSRRARLLELARGQKMLSGTENAIIELIESREAK